MKKIKTLKNLLLGGCTALFAFSLSLAGLGAFNASANASERQTREIISFPEISSINRPYKTTEELNVDFDAIDALFPQNIEIKHEGSKIYIEDIGAGAVRVNSSNGDVEQFVLVDGFWTAEIGETPWEYAFIHYHPDNNSSQNFSWRATYYENGEREPYIYI